MAKLRIDVWRFKPREFTKRYGKKTKAGTFPCPKTAKSCEIHIRKNLPKSSYKKVLTHEIGHLVTERAKIASRIPQEERVKLRKWAKEYLSEHRKKVTKRESTREMLAVIYQSKKLDNKSKLAYIKKHFPKSSSLVDEAIKKTKVSQRVSDY